MPSITDASKVVALKAAPCNYGTSHITWDEPSPYLPWTTARILKKFGGAAPADTSGFHNYDSKGATIYEVTSGNYIFTPTAVSGTPIKTITFSGGSGTVTGNNTVSAITYTGGGAVTLTGSSGSPGGVSSFTVVSASSYTSPATFSNIVASGGSGTGATFTVRYLYLDGAYIPLITLVDSGSGYTVGNTLTLTGAFGSATLTVVSLTGILTQTYTVQSLTSSTGKDLQVYVTRSGSSGVANAFVTDITIRSGGTGFVVGDTVTISGTATGGASPANDITLTVTEVKAAPAGSSATQTYYGVAQSSTSGTGTGATFDITRTGLVGSTASVTTVTVKNAGTGYAATNTITILAAAIGASTNLTITVASVETGGGGLLTASSNYNVGYAGSTIANEKNASYVDVPVFSATGSGRGGKATVNRNSSGVISSFSITSSGAGYAVGDVLVIPASYLGDYKTNQVQLGVDADFHVYDALFPKYQAVTKSGSNIANITTPLTPSKTVNGVTLSIGDILMVDAQTTASQNGLYTVTNVDSTNMTLVKDTTYDGSPVMVLSGTAGASYVYTFASNTFSTYSAPTVYRGTVEGDGNNPSGKEVYYTLELLYVTTISGAGSYSATPVRVGNVSTRFVGSTGLHDYMLAHLPAWYKTDDLSDFLALFAFHLEAYKADTEAVFSSSNSRKISDKLLPYMLKQFGANYNHINSSSWARKVLSNLVKIYQEKGSAAGIIDAATYYSGSSATVSVGANLLPDINTSSFEQGLGFWTPKFTATTAATYTSNPTAVTGVVTGTGYPSIAVINGSAAAGAVNAFNYTATSTDAVTGFASLTNASGSAGTQSWKIGPRTAFATTAVSVNFNALYPVTNATVEVGDYVIAVRPSDGKPYFEPGTKVSAVSGSTVYTDKKSLIPWAGTSAVYFSKTATDLTGILSTYPSVSPNVQYTFSAYLNRASGTARDVTIGIDWIKADGTLSSTSTGTLTAATQSATNTWYRGSVTATAPVDAVYASPYVSVVSMGSGQIYYMDACQLEAAGSATTYQDANVVTVNLPSAAASQVSRMKAIFGDYITYGQGPVGTAGAIRSLNSAAVEVVPMDPPVTPTSYWVPATGASVLLTMPTGHGFSVNDIITVSYDPAYSPAIGLDFTPYDGVYQISGTSATSISYGAYGAPVATTSVPVAYGAKVAKVKEYKVTYLCGSAHSAVPGNQVTISSSVSVVNIGAAEIVGTPTPYKFTLTLPNSYLITGTAYSPTGAAYIDFGRSGSTKITT